MKPNTISLRRRQLMIAGLVATSTPAAVFSGQCTGAVSLPGGATVTGPLVQSLVGENLIVSGRVIDVDCNAVAGARVEVRSVPASTTTDADGRFMLAMSATDAGASRALHMEVRAEGYHTHSTQVPFARTATDESIAHPVRDETGVWRSTFGLTVA